MEIAGQLNIVVADHRHPARHIDAMGAQRVNRGHGQQVAAGEDGVERDRAAQQFLHRRAATVRQEGHRQLQRRIGGKRLPGQGLAIALIALRHFRQMGVAEEGDALAALRQQVRGGQRAAGQVVAADGAVQLLRQLRAPHHDRHLACGQLVQLFMMAPLADEHDADHAAGIERCRSRIELLGIDARHQHVEALLGQRVGQAAQHAQEKGIGQVLARGRVVRDDHADGAVLLQAQVLRADVDGVLERARQLHDAGAGFIVDQRAATKGARYGRGRDAGQPCDVGHLQAPLLGRGGAVGSRWRGLGHGKRPLLGQGFLEPGALRQRREPARRARVVVAASDCRAAQAPAGHCAEPMQVLNGGIGRPRIVRFKLVVQLLCCPCKANFADRRTGV